MKLLKMQINNFKAIKQFTFEPIGEDKSIFGKNGIGKTSLADAYFWVLIGKSSQDKKIDDDIKLKDNTGNPQIDNGIEHSVSCTFKLDSGVNVVLAKTYQEKWTKNHGKATAEFTGHITSYFIDSVQKNQKEYIAYIEKNIGDIEALKMLSSATFFCSMPWKKQREILLNVCGDISDTEVINADEMLKSLPTMLEGKSVNDFITMISQSKSKINAQLDKIPTRIDENIKLLDTMKDLQEKEVIETELNSLQKELDGIEKQKIALNNGYASNNLENQVTKIDTEIEKIKQQCNFKSSQELIKLNTKKAELEQNIKHLHQEIVDKTNLIERKQKEINSLDEKIESCRNAWREENKKEFTYQYICPTCGQKLPVEQIEKAKVNFNLTKAENKKACIMAGKELTLKRDNLFNELAVLTKDINSANEKINRLNQELEIIIQQISSLENNRQENSNTYIDDEDYKKLYHKRDILQKEIIDIKDNNSAKIQQYNSQIEQIKLDINIRMEKLSQYKQYEQIKTRIEELKAEQKSLGKEFETLEYKLNLAQIFTKNKIKMLTDKINTKFNITKFKLFTQQINGCIDDTCEAMTINGSTYSKSMSNGEKIKIGLDICSTLSKHYKLDLPIWIDNAECVSDILKVDSQMFNLVVAHHDELTIKDPILKRI